MSIFSIEEEVFTDGIHLVAPNLSYLHKFAASIGLARSWFQNHRHPHYDLTTLNATDRAIRAGAVEIEDTRTLVKLSRSWIEYRREIVCPDCGSKNKNLDSSWRWAGDHWQHRCAGVNSQAGHWRM